MRVTNVYLGLGRAGLALLLVAVCAGLVAGCSRLDASRSFYDGVAAHQRDEHEQAVRSFERAARARPHPDILYNVVVARVAWMRKAARGARWSTARDEHLEAGRAAVDAASAAHEGRARRRAELAYMKGVMHRLGEDERAAQAAFREALARDGGYAPALRELLALSDESDSLVARYVLAAVSVQEPELVSKLKL